MCIHIHVQVMLYHQRRARVVLYISCAYTQAAAVQCRLKSVGGDVRATFSGGAINGSYRVRADEPGIGTVGIVIDDAPALAREGRLGTGNASVHVEHNYGNLALAMSSKAPSAFADLLEGGGGGAVYSMGSREPRDIALHGLLRPALEAGIW